MAFLLAAVCLRAAQYLGFITSFSLSNKCSMMRWRKPHELSRDTADSVWSGDARLGVLRREYVLPVCWGMLAPSSPPQLSLHMSTVCRGHGESQTCWRRLLGAPCRQGLPTRNPGCMHKFLCEFWGLASVHPPWTSLTPRCYIELCVCCHPAWIFRLL